MGPKEMNLEQASKVVQFGQQYFVSLKGNPVSEEVEPTENPHVEGQMDEWHTVKYDGCQVTYYRVVPEKRNILSSLELKSPKVQLPLGLHVGVPKSAVLHALGKPTTAEGELLVYECGDPYAQTVSFTISKGVVMAINWEYEID
jgi:hypothetical protein